MVSSRAVNCDPDHIRPGQGLRKRGGPAPSGADHTDSCDHDRPPGGHLTDPSSQPAITTAALEPPNAKLELMLLLSGRSHVANPRRYPDRCRYPPRRRRAWGRNRSSLRLADPSVRAYPLCRYPRRGSGPRGRQPVAGWARRFHSSRAEPESEKRESRTPPQRRHHSPHVRVYRGPPGHRTHKRSVAL